MPLILGAPHRILARIKRVRKSDCLQRTSSALAETAGRACSWPAMKEWRPVKESDLTEVTQLQIQLGDIAIL